MIAAPPQPYSPPTAGPATQPRRVAPARAGREVALLLALAVITEIVYALGFVLPYPLAGNYQTPLLDLNRLNGHTPESANWFALTWAVAFTAMWIAYRRCPARPSHAYLGVLGGAALVFNLTLLLMYPTGAADLFDQLFRARELAVYGQNPFLVAPNAPLFAADPFRAYVGSWANTTSPYGPVWETLAAGAARLAGDDLWRALLAFKGLVILAYAAACCLIYATLHRVRPDWAARGLLLFAWSPLVLWETAGNGHNDMVMIAFMLAALWLMTRGNRAMLFAPVVLALAALCKFVPALLLPPMLAAIWQLRRPVAGPRQDREGWYGAASAVLTSAAGFLITGLVCYAPFWGGSRTIGALARRDLFTASIPNSLKEWLAPTLGDGAAADLVRSLATYSVGLTVLAATLWLWRGTRPGDRPAILDRLFRACYTIFLVYLLAGTLWFQPWYQGWLVALTPLVARTAYSKRTLVVNGGGVANYFVWDFLVLWNNSWGTVVQWSAALAVNAPVLLYSAYQWLVPPSESLTYPPPAEKESTAV